MMDDDDDDAHDDDDNDDDDDDDDKDDDADELMCVAYHILSTELLCVVDQYFGSSLSQVSFCAKL